MVKGFKLFGLWHVVMGSTTGTGVSIHAAFDNLRRKLS